MRLITQGLVGYVDCGCTGLSACIAGRREELCHTGAAESPEVKNTRVMQLFAWEMQKGERRQKKCTLLFASAPNYESSALTIRSANLKRSDKSETYTN